MALTTEGHPVQKPKCNQREFDQENDADVIGTPRGRDNNGPINRDNQLQNYIDNFKKALLRRIPRALTTTRNFLAKLIPKRHGFAFNDGETRGVETDLNILWDDDGCIE